MFVMLFTWKASWKMVIMISIVQKGKLRLKAWRKLVGLQDKQMTSQQSESKSIWLH